MVFNYCNEIFDDFKCIGFGFEKMSLSGSVKVIYNSKKVFIVIIGRGMIRVLKVNMNESKYMSRMYSIIRKSFFMLFGFVINIIRRI